jgi:MSHA biogenesis protein MshP
LQSKRQRGAALVTAIFLLVVVASLGAFAVQISMGQQQTTDSLVSNARAEAAAAAGLQYAAARLLATQDCGRLDPAFALIHDFTITIAGCAAVTPAPVVAGVPQNIFVVQVTASRGVYGRPGFVSRSTTGRITL